MKKALALLVILELVLELALVASSGVNAEETFTTSPFAYTGISQGTYSTTRDDLSIFSLDYGVKRIGYLAFDLSDFPQGAIPTSIALRIECSIISTKCYVSAFCALSTEWVGKNITWEDRPALGTCINANYINTMEEWYTFSSAPLDEAILTACANRSTLTISLKTGINEGDQYGLVAFFPATAILQISYTVATVTPSPTATPTLSPSPSPSPQQQSTPSPQPTSGIYLSMPLVYATVIAFITLIAIIAALIIKRKR